MLGLLQPKSALLLSGITEVAEQAGSACHTAVFVEEGARSTFTSGMGTGTNTWKYF